MGMIWFTSDSHWGHANILAYQNRPFASLAEHDAELIARWNAVVRPGDVVYHLGDVAFYRDRDAVEALLAKLGGQKHLIVGNHDRDPVTKARGWASVQHWREVKIPIESGGEAVLQRVILFHYPQVTWKGQHKGSWALHGHCHGNLKRDTLGAWVNARTFDIGVDCWGFRPISFEEVAAEIARPIYGYTPVDHHGAGRGDGGHEE